jgi:hypothetical protein
LKFIPVMGDIQGMDVPFIAGSPFPQPLPALRTPNSGRNHRGVNQTQMGLANNFNQVKIFLSDLMILKKILVW